MAITIATTMPKSDLAQQWKLIAGAALSVIATGALTANYIADVTATRAADQFRTSDYLLKPQDVAPIGTTPSRTTIERAIAADPLDQSLVNTAMMQLGRPSPTQLPSPAWFVTLSQYGWRSTAALQNLIYYHATRQEIGPILDVADALFRREKLPEQATAVFTLAESDPRLRTDVVRRLRAHPSWRRRFLLGSNILTNPAVIEGRYQTLRALQRSGDPLPEQEMTALLPVLIRVDRAPDAFALWSYGRTDHTRPLNDPYFLQAAATAGQDDTAKPFNWRFYAGDNFDVTTNGRGSPGIKIHWEGKGVPVFAAQQTSGPSGGYRLQVSFNESDIMHAKVLGYRMMCGAVRVDFSYVGSPDPSHTDWRTIRSVPCAFPKLEIFGSLADRRQDITTSINSITLHHIEK